MVIPDVVWSTRGCIRFWLGFSERLKGERRRVHLPLRNRRQEHRSTSQLQEEQPQPRPTPLINPSPDPSDETHSLDTLQNKYSSPDGLRLELPSHPHLDNELHKPHDLKQPRRPSIPPVAIRPRPGIPRMRRRRKDRLALGIELKSTGEESVVI